MVKRSRRRWTQYNLRFAFLVTLIAAVLCWWCRRIEVTRQALITEVESLGGEVVIQPPGWLPSFPGARVTDVVLPHNKTARIDLERLRAFPKLKNLRFTDVRYEREGMRWSAARLNVEVAQIHESLNELRARPSDR